MHLQTKIILIINTIIIIYNNYEVFKAISIDSDSIKIWHLNFIKVTSSISVLASQLFLITLNVENLFINNLFFFMCFLFLIHFLRFLLFT